MYKAPKAILNHPGVLECGSAEAGGCATEEYTHDVLLREGWEWQRGRNAGGRTGLFKTVADFKYWNPIKA